MQDDKQLAAQYRNIRFSREKSNFSVYLKQKKQAIQKSESAKEMATKIYKGAFRYILKVRD